jgi:hypothetical protein
VSMTSQATGGTSLGAWECCRPMRANKTAGNHSHRARHRVIRDVIGQKSAEAIVAKGLG